MPSSLYKPDAETRAALARGQRKIKAAQKRMDAESKAARDAKRAARLNIDSYWASTG